MTPANDNRPPMPLAPRVVRVRLMPPDMPDPPLITPVGVLMAVLAFVLTYAVVSALVG